MFSLCFQEPMRSLSDALEAEFSDEERRQRLDVSDSRSTLSPRRMTSKQRRGKWKSSYREEFRVG